LEAVAFLQKLNTVVFGEYPHTIMVAEESTAWPMVTKPVVMGGLGFNFKWNMGWMNDVTEYIKVDPYFRRDHHNKLTFSMVYAFSENFILPISHDEVVYGKGSLINKMFGDYYNKFEGFRTFLAYMYAHPGKKLIFMGSEIAQFDEWNNDYGLQFNLLLYDKHYKTREFVKDLNKFYFDTPQLFEVDFSWKGFRWLAVNDFNSNVLAFARVAKDGSELICVFNFSPVERKNYKLKVSAGLYEEVFSTTRPAYGGRVYSYGKTRTKSEGDTSYMEINIAPMGGVFFKKTLNRWIV